MKRTILSLALASFFTVTFAQTNQIATQNPATDAPKTINKAEEYAKSHPASGKMKSAENVAQNTDKKAAGNKAEEYAKQNAAEISFDKTSYDFGKIKQGEKANYEFKFKNTGKFALVITNAQASCGCTTPFYTREPVEPGKEGSIKVMFNSDGKFGKQDKTITITSNAKNSPMVLHMTGEVLDKNGKTMANPFEKANAKSGAESDSKKPAVVNPAKTAAPTNKK